MISKEKGEEVAGDRLLEGVTDKIFKDKWYYSNNRDSAHILARKILSLVCKRIEGAGLSDEEINGIVHKNTDQGRKTYALGNIVYGVAKAQLQTILDVIKGE